jgi:integrase
MSRQSKRLSIKTVASRRKPGYYADGAGLYLQVSKTGTKAWIFRYTRGLNTNPHPKFPNALGKPKQHEMGLGSLNAVGLAEARKRAEACRLLLVDGIDPRAARDSQKAQAALARASAVSFQRCADGYIAAHRSGWRNPKHAGQWKTTIETYCGPVIGALPVQAVDTSLVLRVLEPIWSTKPETASRLRGRIQSIIDWATVNGYRTGDNPARWDGHLKEALPALSKESRVQHHAALPYVQVGAFVQNLRTQEGTAARALEFTILTACRTGEAIGAKPSEFDLDKELWTIPAARMKAGREHRVPLSRRAIEIVRAQLKLDSEYVFPGLKLGNPLSNMAMLALLKRMKRSDFTVHGFRSTFRDWAAEQTAYPHEVCEMALAHAVGNKVEAAYLRGELLQKRQLLADDWAKYCEQITKAGKVTPIRKAN